MTNTSKKSKNCSLTSYLTDPTSILTEMKEIYLDNSATTPLCPEAIDAITRATAEFGNPSSVHMAGIRAKKMVENARLQLQKALSIRPSDPKTVIFTSCGSEANNLALFGTVKAKHFRFKPRIVTTDSEHPSIGEPLALLERSGEAEIVRLSTKGGRLDMDELKNAVNKETVLLTLMTVNNETGAFYDVAKAFSLAKAANPDVITHTDLTQGFLKVAVPGGYCKLGADMITVSGHKIGAPKGIGALIVSNAFLRSKKLIPWLYGGGQEGGLRSGTENTIGIAALGAAAEAGSTALSAHIEQCNALRQAFLTALPDSVKVNQPPVYAPHIISITLPSIKSQTALNALSAEGIYVSSGSACSSHGGHKSYVLLAYGLSPDDADCTLRISLSPMNTEDELVYTAKTIGRLCDTIIKIH